MINHVSVRELSALLKEHFQSTDEGWHAIYKKYGWRVLARDNYKWKRKIMKRFGPNKAMQDRIMWRKQLTDNNYFLSKLPEYRLREVLIPFRRK